MIIALLLLLAASPLLLPKSVVDRAFFTIAQPKEAGQIHIGNLRIDTSTSARIISWQKVLFKDFYKNAILGYGVTGYAFMDAQFPRVLVETGLLGLIAFLFLIRAIFKNAVYVYHNSKDPSFNGLALGYLAGFMAMLFHSIGTNTFIIVRIMEPFWFLTAMIIMIPTIEKGALEQRGSAEVPIASRPAAPKRLPWATQTLPSR
jgi:O-antigen ligase